MMTANNFTKERIQTGCCWGKSTKYLEQLLSDVVDRSCSAKYLFRKFNKIYSKAPRESHTSCNVAFLTTYNFKTRSEQLFKSSEFDIESIPYEICTNIFIDTYSRVNHFNFICKE